MQQVVVVHHICGVSAAFQNVFRWLFDVGGKHIVVAINLSQG